MKELLETLLEGLKDIKKLYLDSGKVSEEIFSKFEQGDPSKTKKYLEWMLKQHIKDPTRPGHMVDLIQYFDKMVQKGKVKQKDINQYSGPQAVNKALEEIGDKLSKTEKHRNVKLKEATKAYEDDRLIVINPHTHAAAKLYGKETKWCITSDDDHYWVEYTLNQGAEFYFIIMKKDIGDIAKKGDKLAMALYPGGNQIVSNHFEIFDAEDTEEVGYQNLSEVSQAFGIPEETFEPKDFGDWQMEKFEAAESETYRNIEITIDDLYNNEELHFPVNDPGEQYTEEVYEWISQSEDFGDELYQIDDVKDGAEISIKAVYQALIALGFASTESDEEAEEEFKRRDIPGQTKMSFAENINCCCECLNG